MEMTENIMDWIGRLPIEREQIINSEECVKYIQQFQNYTGPSQVVEHLLLHVWAIIDKELYHTEEKSNIQYNPVVLNIAFRCYYQLLESNGLEDGLFEKYIKDCTTQELYLNEKYFIILQYVLQTNPKLSLNPEPVFEKLLKAFSLAVDLNHVSLVSILKALNMLCKKFPKLVFDFKFPLDTVFFCMQSNQLGMRDECMVLMQHVCTNKELATYYFHCVSKYWPWTNRNKLFLLGCILNRHPLDELLLLTDQSKESFFLGLRSTLNYKNLFAPSQYVIKALSSQKSLGLLELSVNIITSGNKKEIQNFYDQWFSRMQTNELWEVMKYVPENDLFEETLINLDEHSYRLILIFNMFSKQILQISNLHFTKMSTELMANCFEYDIECQLLIFKFIVDNLANLAVEDSMGFVRAFLKVHSSIENAQFRNTVLGKMANFFNYVAKIFSKQCSNSEQFSSLKWVILNFFVSLQNNIYQDLAKDTYQPKIFSLKLLEILLKSLFTEAVLKNPQNQQLSQFLKHEKVFDDQILVLRLIELINDPFGFDDVLELIVFLIKLIKPPKAVVHLALDLCQKACTLPSVDACNLSYLYARVAIENDDDSEQLQEFLQIMILSVKEKLSIFNKDPLLTCQLYRGHLFGFLNVIYELMEIRPELCQPEFMTILTLIEVIQYIVIQKFNVAVLGEGEEVSSAASFQDMHESLEMLVCESAYVSEDHEYSRKLLLMSFWMTLKACCDLAAAMGIYVAKNKSMPEQCFVFLKRCLQVNVEVLTKCRHKGAIEAAGVAIGKLTKSITLHSNENSPEYNLLHLHLEQLCQMQEINISTTRRGAGFPIMFLHIVKNEEHRCRPILKRAIENLLKSPALPSCSAQNPNCDRLEALYLHFLCVLVRDTELREPMSKYYNEIMMAAVSQIDNPEWTICNAALQVFGALVSKIVGQKHANEFEHPLLWEPSDVTFSEIDRKLPKACEYIINYCSGKKSTKSIILFLEFLHKVEFIYMGVNGQENPVFKYRQLMWSLLKHCSEKVRKLAAKCFIRSHEIRVELPIILHQLAQIIFSVKNENFFEGLLFTLQEGILKLQYESRFIIPELIYQQIEEDIKQNLQNSFPPHNKYTFLTLCKLWDLLKLLNHLDLMKKLQDIAQPQSDMKTMFGFDLWLERIQTN